MNHFGDVLRSLGLQSFPASVRELKIKFLSSNEVRASCFSGESYE